MNKYDGDIYLRELYVDEIFAMKDLEIHDIVYENHMIYTKQIG